MRSKLNKLVRFMAHPALWRVLLNHWLRYPRAVYPDDIHLKGAMSWLKAAHQATSSQGVSAGYNLWTGWLPAYPETTGYIIETVIAYSHYAQDRQYLDDAIKMGEWEISIQLPDGSVRGGVGLQDYPIVFNTGQVILGWLALYAETNDPKYLHAAERAGDWLVGIQNPDGSWTRAAYNQRAHAYHARVAWPLLWLGAVTHREKYTLAGERNITWVLSQVENGWIDGMGFADDDNHPLTHTIAYTLRGLIESASFLRPALAHRSRQVATDLAERILHLYEQRKHNPYAMPVILPARITTRFKPAANYSCLTGNAQMAIVWMKIYQITGDARFLNSALKLTDQISATHNLETSDSGLLGGIAGSYPLWGDYMKWVYPNWAVKFFADAILLRIQILAELKHSL